MFNLILRIFLLCYAINAQNIFATSYAYPEDIESSKKSFLISGASYEKLKSKKKGVMTLCFKPIKGDYDHTSLVFEYFAHNSKSPSLTMVHYGRNDGCCGGGDKHVLINDRAHTLKTTYRAQNISNVDGKKTDIPATYTKYASWYIQNDKLLQALHQAEQDQSHKNEKFGSCVKYAVKIMKKAGLEKLDFWWWWPDTPHSLRSLVSDYCRPKPDIKY